MSRTPLTQQEITLLLGKHHILSAVEIVALLDDKGTKNKTTVYRALEKMLAREEICRHSLGSDTLFYELRGHHHDHAVCERCGKVELIECVDGKHEHFAPPGFRVTHHHLTLFGICADCAKVTAR